MQPRAAALLAAALGACLAGGCTSLAGQHAPAPAPVVSPQATASALLAGYLQLLQKLVAGPAADQAEIVRPRATSSNSP